MTNKDSFVEKKVAELMKKECEVRWKEGYMPIVCGETIATIISGELFRPPAIN